MAVMLGRLHAALIAAGVPEDKAREAAEEVAQYREDMHDIKATLRVHGWMLGTVMAFCLVIVGLLLRLQHVI